MPKQPIPESDRILRSHRYKPYSFNKAVENDFRFGNKKMTTSKDLSNRYVQLIYNCDEPSWHSEDDDPDVSEESEASFNSENIEKESIKDFHNYLSFAQHREIMQNTEVDRTEGVFHDKNLQKSKIFMQLIKDLNTSIDQMISKGKDYKFKTAMTNYSKEEYLVNDYHPNSNKTILDIIHPSLFPLIKSGQHKTKLTKEGLDLLKNQKNKIFKEPETSNRYGYNIPDDQQVDFWGRIYEDSIYQWLPSEIELIEDNLNHFGSLLFDPVKKTVSNKFVSPIHNCPRTAENQLKPLLGKLLSYALPKFNLCYQYGKSLNLMKIDCEPDNYNKDENLNQYCVNKSDKIYTKNLPKNLQIITKIVDYNLKPEQIYDEGAWHVEGMSHENIIATMVCCLKKDENKFCKDSGKLRFKRAFTYEEGADIHDEIVQCRPKWVEHVMKEPIYLGENNLKEGEMIVFPNSHIHQLSELKNLSKTDSATRRVIVFWLINPNTRIISTKHVNYKENDKILDYEKAVEHRVKLMEERKYHKQDFNVREISLCEH